MPALGSLDQQPRVRLAHLPTAVEPMSNLRAALFGAGRGPTLLVKRDDCSGQAMGGNKVRQLEFHLGRARADGAVQSNFVRTCAAMSARLGMACHVQLERRVPRHDPLYRDNGNVLLDRIAGAVFHHYPRGEDEAGADAALEALAGRLRAAGSRPHVVHLAPGHPPLGALGYVDMARELLAQPGGERVDRLYLASGSGATHCGTLWGLRALGSAMRVTGVCVRRPAPVQAARVWDGLQRLSSLLGHDPGLDDADVELVDTSRAPGYGQLNAATREAIALAGAREGLFLDPVYSGKVLAGMVAALRDGVAGAGENVMFLHTGGQPALYAYGDDLLDA